MKDYLYWNKITIFFYLQNSINHQQCSLTSLTYNMMVNIFPFPFLVDFRDYTNFSRSIFGSPFAVNGKQFSYMHRHGRSKRINKLISEIGLISLKNLEKKKSYAHGNDLHNCKRMWFRFYQIIWITEIALSETRVWVPMHMIVFEGFLLLNKFLWKRWCNLNIELRLHSTILHAWIRILYFSGIRRTLHNYESIEIQV